MVSPWATAFTSGRRQDADLDGYLEPVTGTVQKNGFGQLGGTAAAVMLELPLRVVPLIV